MFSTGFEESTCYVDKKEVEKRKKEKQTFARLRSKRKSKRKK